MNLFLTNEEHFGFINKCLDENPKKVLISTFGIWAGFTHDGQDSATWKNKAKTNTRLVLDRMHDVPSVQMLISMGPYKSCKGKEQCLACEAQYAKSVFRLIEHEKAYPNFRWRMTFSSHLKCMLFFYPSKCVGISGGRNFTDSEWADLSFEIDQDNILKIGTHVVGIWKTATPITNDAMSGVLESQGISMDGIKLLMK